jgi:hypothetical protein
MSKSKFQSEIIRPLTKEEHVVLGKVELVVSGKSTNEILTTIPSFVSEDGKVRNLVLSNKIANKIKEHGIIIKENLVLNATDWDYVIRNVAGVQERINLIKTLANGGFIRIGANKDNGYFIVTHYENIVDKSQKLKNLLKKGDALDRFGRTPFLT